MDVAYGGNFYAIVDTQARFTDLADHPVSDLLRWSPVLRRRLNESHGFVHPTEPGIGGLSHVLWTGAPRHPEALRLTVGVPG